VHAEAHNKVTGFFFVISIKRSNAACAGAPFISAKKRCSYADHESSPAQ
jgi:hypothetical protein